MPPSPSRTERPGPGAALPGAGVYHPASPCEAEAARRYAFDGLDAAPAWERIRCPAGPRYRMLFLRSRAEGSTSELSWRVYDVCDAHVHRLRYLDDAMTHAGHPSQLHPMTGAALRLIEPSLTHAAERVESLPAA